MRPNLRAVFDPQQRGLTFERSDLPPAGGGTAIAKVEVAGVCGTDAHRLAGEVPHQGGPLVFGHEAVGRLVEHAGDVTTDWVGEPVAVGDLLLWLPASGCGRCRGCTLRLGQGGCEQLVWPPAASQAATSAGFQEYAALGPHVAFFKAPVNADPHALIALGCALPTAIAGMERLGNIGPDDTVVVQGCGPVGLAAALLASRTPAASVIVIGGPASRLDAAEAMGATHTISLDLDVAARRAAVADLTADRGADVVIEAAGVIDAFEEGVSLLGAGGRYLVLGLYAGATTASLNPFRLNNLNATILGSLSSHPRHGYQAMRLASRPSVAPRLAALLTQTYPLHELNDAVSAMASGAAIKTAIAAASGA